MAITIQERRATEFVATRETRNVLIPRSYTNANFHEIMGFRTRTLFTGPAGDILQYSAFPSSLPYLLDGKLIGIYSDGPAHGDSDRQVMFRIDDPEGFERADVQQVDFRINGEAGYNTSLLTGLIANGDRHVLKRFLLTGTPGGVVASLLDLPTDGGNTYNHWSRPKQLSDGDWYRGGYSNAGTFRHAALLKSTDDQETWSYVSTVATDAALSFTEFDFVETSTGNLVALVREDTTDGRPLYLVESDDLGLTWSPPVLQNQDLIGGVQPSAITLDDGTFLWMYGDRTGLSGSSAEGMPLPFGDCTGIAAQRMRHHTITAGTYSGGMGTITFSAAHNISIGNVVSLKGNTPSGWDGVFVAGTGTSGSSLVVKMADPGGSITVAGAAVSFGWHTQVGTYVSTDGGQPTPTEITPGVIVAPFYGVRRYGERPRIQFLTFKTMGL